VGIMKVKNFAFGFGLGIIFVSIVLIVVYNSYSNKKVVSGEVVENEISDKEVISRAEDLGMAFYINLPDKAKIMAELSTEITTNVDIEEATGAKEDNADIEITTSEIVDDVKEDNTNIEVTQAIDADNELEEKTENDNITNNLNETTQEQTNAVKDDVNEITIKIDSGTDAATVSKMLEKAGIIEKADEYLNYIIDNKKANKIMAGTYQFKDNMSYKEITDIITR